MGKKVLFVCIRNTARSIIAEAIFNSMSKNHKAESAGIERAEKIDEKVKEILEKRGLIVKDKPKSLKDVDLGDYDSIITVCEESLCIVLSHKRLLKWNIEDPVGKSEEVYERVFMEIEERVKELLRELEGN